MTASNWAFVFDSGATVKNLYTDYSINVTGWTGGGMPPTRNITVPYALGDGSYFQRTVIGERVIQLACAPVPSAPFSMSAIHSKRKAIIAAINRDILNSGTFTLRYYGAGATSIDISVRYNGGMEMDSAADDPFQSFSISLLAEKPFWLGSSLNTVNMNTSTVISNGTWMVQSTNGVWAGANAGANNIAESPNAIVSTAAGITYIGTAAALYVRAANGTFTKYATTGGAIWCLALGLDGTTVYIGGNFTNLGGAGVARCVKLVGTTFSNPSSGAVPGTPTVLGISAGPNYLWITINEATTGSSVYRCPYGGAWATLTNNVTHYGNCCYNSQSDTFLYFAAQPDAGTIQHLYLYNGTTLTDYGAVAGAGEQIYSIIPGYTLAGGGITTPPLTGVVVIGGQFTSIGGSTFTNVAALVGSSWTNLGSGVINGTVISMALVNGVLFAAGQFTNTGFPFLMQYQAGGWTSGGITTVQANTAIAYNATTNTISLGFAAPGTAPTTAGTAGATAINNTSDRFAYPIITITASGATILQSITNTYTGDALLFAYAMSTGEVITINTTPGIWSIVSSYAGNILGQLLAGSDLTSFGVSPGNRTYTMQFSDGTKATATFAYYYTYYSSDSVA